MQIFSLKKYFFTCKWECIVFPCISDFQHSLGDFDIAYNCKYFADKIVQSNSQFHGHKSCHLVLDCLNMYFKVSSHAEDL